MEVMRISRRWALVGASALAVLALMLGLRALGSDSAGASDFEQFREAVARAEDRSGGVAARVNGVDIPLAKLEAFAVSRSTAIGLESGVASVSAEEFLDELIRIELQYQEAVRRGLAPTDAEILETATQTKEGLLVALESDDPSADNLREMFEEFEGSPYHVDVYDSSPQMLESIGRSMAVSRLRSDVFAAAGNPTDPATKEALVDEMVSVLRAAATIEVLADFK